MRSASIGTRAASRLSPRKGDRKRAGFTLIEALVALALVVAFAGALGPYLFHARRIMAGVDGRIAAQVLLRALLEAPFDRSTLAQASREGEAARLRWRIIAEPVHIDALPSRRLKASPVQGPNASAAERPSWAMFRLAATVSWGPGLSISADTLRLGKAE
jgi:prepilin-type N-terminal cleavage/methylation domain-containing protein